MAAHTRFEWAIARRKNCFGGERVATMVVVSNLIDSKKTESEL